jgi:nucleotide-binding universal stress UspA family protein
VAVAAAVAAQTHQTLDLVAVPPSGYDHRRTDAFLRSCVATAREAGVSTIAWSVLDGSPATAIIEHVGAAGSTMLCLGTRARSALKELLLGSVSEPVVREATVPVVLVGPRCAVPEGRYRRVVACIDDSAATDPVLTTAERLGHLAQVPIEELRAAHPRSGDDAADDLDVLAPPPPLGGEAASAAILAALGDDPATIAVVGTEARRGLDRLLFASVAMDVTRRARGPVVVLPPALTTDD